MYTLIINNTSVATGLQDSPTWNITAQGWETRKGFFQDPEQAAIICKTQDLRAEITAACQARLAQFAATRGYSSLDAISKYKDITGAEIDSLPAEDQPLVTRFRGESRYMALVVAQTWAVLYRGLAEVEAGTRPMPTSLAEIEAELPALAWPV